MKIKAYSFERNSLSTADIKASVVEQLTDKSVFFESFSEPNELFKELSEALTKANAILLGVEPQLYLKFKPILIKAFGFTPAYSEKAENRIGSEITDEKLLKAHLLVPNESTELLSENGLYSGFYVCANNQYIVVFPLDSKIVPEILLNADLPFIAAEKDKKAIFSEIMGSSASEKARNIVSKLVKNNVKLSVSSTPAAAALKEDVKACSNYENNVFFTPFVNDTGAGDKKEYAAELAKGSMELRSADLGAAVSNIFREKDGDKVKGYYAFISVTTADRAVVRKLIADASESVDNLVAEATNELYSMIDKYLDEVIFKKTATEEELKKYEASLIEAEYKADERPIANLGKKGTIIAIAALAAAVIICIILGFKFRGYFVNPSDKPEESTLQTNPKTTQSVPSTEFTFPSTTNNDVTIDVTEESSENEIIVFESFTSIFDVTTTVPVFVPAGTDNNRVIYTQPKTTHEETTEKQTTEKQTTEKQTTKPKPTETTDDGMVHGEM